MCQERNRNDRTRYGGRHVTVECPSYEIALVDPKFTRYVSVRCGACGGDVRQTTIRSSIASSLERQG